MSLQVLHCPRVYEHLHFPFPVFKARKLFPEEAFAESLYYPFNDDDSFFYSGLNFSAWGGTKAVSSESED